MKMLFACILSSCFLVALPHKGEVTLATANPLLPIYVSHVDGSPYEQSLESVFLHDVGHNGRLKIAPRTDLKEQRLKAAELTEQFDRVYWKREGIPFACTISCSKKFFSAYVFDGRIGLAREFISETLSGDIEHDRVRIHKVADAISKWLFQDKGIATSHILYARQVPRTGGFDSEIWAVDWDGNNPHKVGGPAGYCVTPFAIPNSQSFLFVSYARGVPKILLGRSDAEDAMPIISLRGNQLLPALSANKRTMAFICDASGRADLFVQVFDEHKGCLGKPIQAYSFPSSVQASPTLSPDGSRIAFVSDKSGTPRVYMIHTPRYSRGNKLPKTILLSKECRENTSPCWSPDGNKIAYSARIDGIRQIVIYDLILGEEWQVTSGPLHKENPSWAPNSLHLVYNTVDGEKSDLYVVDIHAKVPNKITSGPGKKHFPSWGSL